MYYTVYRITNNINGKFYVGKHQTRNLDDGYMGSGKILKLAIQKYGIENFTKEILFVFGNEEEMNAKEKELVSLGEGSYNLCSGGQGGFGYVNSLPESKEWTARGRAEANKVLARKSHEKTKYNYEINPKICEICNNKIPYEKRHNKLCSKTCRGLKTNILRWDYKLKDS